MIKFCAAGDSDSEDDSFDISCETETNLTKQTFQNDHHDNSSKLSPSYQYAVKSNNDLIMMTDLQNAVINGNLGLVSQIIKSSFYLCNALLGSGWTALMYGANFGKLKVVKFLLKHGADANICGPSGCTALMAACKSYCEDETAATIINLLLNSGAVLESKDSNGRTVLMYAARSGSSVRLQNILKHCDSTELNCEDNQGWTALDWAISRNNSPLVHAIVKKGNFQVTFSDHPYICNEIKVILNKCQEESGNFADNTNPVTTNNKKDGSAHVNATIPSSIIPNGRQTSIDEVPLMEIQNEESQHNYQQYGQLELLLNGLELSQHIELFHMHDVKFEQLLCFTIDDLTNIGITQHGVKLRILKAVKDWHTMDWKENSLPNFSGKLITYSNTQAVLRATNEHLQYISGSFRYVKNQLHEHPHLLLPQSSMFYEQNPLTNVQQQIDDILHSSHELCCSLKCLRSKIQQLPKENLNLQLTQVDMVEQRKYHRGGKWLLAASTLFLLYFAKTKLFTSIVFMTNFPETFR